MALNLEVFYYQLVLQQHYKYMFNNNTSSIPKYKFTSAEYSEYGEWSEAGIGGEYITGLMITRGYTDEQICDEVIFLRFQIEFTNSYTLYLKRVGLVLKLKLLKQNIITRYLYQVMRIQKLLGISSDAANEFLAEEDEKRLLSQFK